MPTRRTRSTRKKSRPTTRRKALAPVKVRSGRGIMDRLRERIALATESISNERVLELLSEGLAVEKGGTQLYELAFERSTDPEHRKKYKMYLMQTHRHARLLSGAIRKLGGDPRYKSPGAMAQERLVEAMLEIDVPAELRELKDAEHLLLAETKDHMDWEFLKKITARVESDTRAILTDIVSQVEDEEDEHLEFARKAVEKLSLEVAMELRQRRRRSDLAA
jgi:rubrerythrin